MGYGKGETNMEDEGYHKLPRAGRAPTESSNAGVVFLFLANAKGGPAKNHQRIQMLLAQSCQPTELSHLV